MNWHEKVRRLQIDLTSYCNAKCPACVRNIYGNEIRPGLELNHFDVELWNRLWQQDTRGWYIAELQLNGNWGDPGMHPQLPEMIDTASRSHPYLTVFMHTNGGMHNTAWWAELAKQMKWLWSHAVHFAVDGLADTHAVYRRNTKFEKVCENIKSFTDAGGRAGIITTLFDHNRHQIAEIKQLAKDLNCTFFRTRKSNCSSMTVESNTENYQITTEYCNSESTINIQLDDNRPRNRHVRKDALHLTGIGKLDTKCPWYNDRMVQIDPWGNVWPCCHISLYGNGLHPATEEFDLFLETSKYSLDNNLNSHMLETILQSDWYTSRLHKTVHGSEPWGVCKRSCGV
jgi:MoaA/NifB/PqqE/SkfB family radical SAM enzyme